jgi:hypothetical protein
MFGGGGVGWWSPTENKPAMKAYADRFRGRRRRRQGGWRRRLVGAVAVAAVTVGIFFVVSAIVTAVR